MSRALGDIEYKGTKKEDYWDTEFSDDLVIAVPDVDIDILTSTDAFLLLACDGYYACPYFPSRNYSDLYFYSIIRLWDVFTNQEAVEFIQGAIGAHHKPEVVARKLVEEAIKKGSMDNITICLVFL